MIRIPLVWLLGVDPVVAIILANMETISLANYLRTLNRSIQHKHVAESHLPHKPRDLQINVC